MTNRSCLLLFATLVLPAPAVAQHAAASPAPSRPAPREATQFDFLVGQWEIVARPAASGLAARIHGAPKLLGTWKAWRGLDGWGIEDEVRLADESGNPRGLSHSVRVYDLAARRWNGSTLDVYRATFSSNTGEWRDGAMMLSSRGTEQEGGAYVMRTRYYDVTPTSFRVQQDRSYDDGRTWSEGILRIEAKRVAATAPR